MAVWGDDFAFMVASEMLFHLTELLERNFECKLIGNIGPGMPLKVVKLLLYHALDRPDLQFAVGRLMSAVTKPQRKHLAMMKHCLMYMLGRF